MYGAFNDHINVIGVYVDLVEGKVFFSKFKTLKPVAFHLNDF